MFIDQNIIEEINDKDHYLNRNQLSLDRSLTEFSSYSVFNEALQHSARMETSFSKIYKDTITKEMKQRIQKEYKNALNGLKKARKYGLKNFDLPFKESFIKKIASIILCERTDYRETTEGVRPSGATITPPYPAKLHLEMERLEKGFQKLYDFMKEKKIGYINLAVLTHFHLARIHPFEDGNGRTARLLQNTILEKNQYPNIVIKDGERAVYHQLLDNACVSFKKREADLSKEEKLFEISRDENHLFNFLGSKVIIALDDIIDGKYTF